MQNKSAVLKTASISLISYSHNDNNLLVDSLRQICSWSILPKEIILVDDASDTPFVLPELVSPIPIKILRSPVNLGYTKAKAMGLNAANCKFILSLDADTRLTPNWLELCLPRAAETDIGMVGGPVIPRCGEHLFGKYMALTYSINTGVKGPVKFISGAAWLMKRAVWQAVDGFGDYSDRAGEDDALCKKLLSHDYRLWLEEKALAYEVRPMNRLNMVARGWQWHGISIKRAIESGSSLEEAINVLLYSMRIRTEKSRQADPRFLYYDLLYLSNGLMDLLKDQPVMNALGAELNKMLAPYPLLNQALSNDLAALGHNHPKNQTAILSTKNDSKLNLPRALAFAFDDNILNTLNCNIDEILEDVPSCRA